MAISFEIPEHVRQQAEMARFLAEGVMRPISREMDEDEHKRPWPFIEQIWPILRDQQKRQLEKLQNPEPNGDEKKGRPSTAILRLMFLVEMLSWGDAGIYLCLPSAALGGSAIEAVG